LWIFWDLLILFFYNFILVMSDQEGGNIAYSFNKNDYYNIIKTNKTLFHAYYIITVFVSFFFLTGSFVLNGISIGKWKTIEEIPENQPGKNNEQKNNGEKNGKGSLSGMMGGVNEENNNENNQNKNKGNEKKERKAVNNGLYNYFYELTLGSPFNIINFNKDGMLETLTEKEKKEGKFVSTFIGFSQNTNIFLIIVNLIGIFIILEALLKNLMSSIIVNFVQANPNNNPYNNPNCVTKVKDSVSIYINSNYSKLMVLSFLFMIPFSTTFVLRHILKIDLYDIKKTQWIKIYIFISLIIPTLIIIFYRLTGYKSITLFSTIYKYIDTKDYEYIGFMKQMFSLKYFIMYVFLFVAFIFLSLHWIYGSMNKYITGWKKYALYIFIFVFIYFIVPNIMASNAISTIYNVYKVNNIDNNIDNTENEVIENIEKKGCQSLFDLIVKYNYPCFKN